MPRPEDERRLLARGTTDHYSDPVLYDVEYNDYEPDIQWYCDLVKERAKSNGALELGCGSGRITIPVAKQLAKSKQPVAAIDCMAPMLESIKGKLDDHKVTNVTALEGDIRELPFEDESFDVVFAAFNTLMHLYTWEDLLQCMREAHRVLVPGGTFAFDVLVPDIEWLGMDSDERQCEGRFLHPTLGQTMVYSTNHTYNTDTQVCHIRIFHDSDLDGERFGAEPSPTETLTYLAHRQIFPEEIRMLTTFAKFRLESLSGDFLDLSLNSDIESQVVVCVKPSGKKPTT